MASYPGSVFAPTNKTDKVDLNAAADMNAVQNEIVALENAIGLNPKGALADLVTRLAIMMDTYGAVQNGTSFPGSPVTAQIFFRTDLNKYYIYFSSSWNEIGSGVDYTAGSYLEASNNTERSTGSGSYVELKEFSPLIRGGILTISWDMKSAVSGTTTGTYLYVNSTPVIEKLDNSTTYVTKTNNTTVSKGDVLKIYGKSNATCYCQNFQLYTGKPTIPVAVSGM